MHRNCVGGTGLTAAPTMTWCEVAGLLHPRNEAHLNHLHCLQHGRHGMCVHHCCHNQTIKRRTSHSVCRVHSLDHAYSEAIRSVLGIIGSQMSGHYTEVGISPSMEQKGRETSRSVCRYAPVNCLQ